jgi:hypothetical protein
MTTTAAAFGFAPGASPENLFIDPAAADKSPTKPPGTVPTATQAATPEKNGVLVNPKGNGGATRVGSGDRVIAQVLRPAVAPATLVKGWSRAIAPHVPTVTPRLGTPQLPSTVPGLIRLAPAPTILTRPNIARPTPLGGVFGSGSQVLTVPGVPQLTGRPSTTTLGVVNKALTAERLSQFSALRPEQKLVARTMMAAAIEGLQAPPGSDQRIASPDFDAAVAEILRQSQLYVTPGSDLKLAEPLPKPSTLLPPEPTVLGLPTPTVMPARPAQAATQVAPAYPSTGPNDPEPTWWKEACNDPSDPQMGGKLVRLVTDSREFAAQAATIDIDRPVDPARSTLTPRQEWNNWKQA